MGLQIPYTPVQFRPWPQKIKYVLPEWRNGIREGLKILCQQWLVGSSPTPGTLESTICLLPYREFSAIIHIMKLNSLEQPPYIPGEYKGADKEKDEPTVGDQEAEQAVSGIMNALTSPGFTESLSRESMDKENSTNQVELPALISGSTGEIYRFLNRKEPDNEPSIDNSSRVLFVHDSGIDKSGKKVAPPHIKGFKLTEEGISPTALKNLTEAIERLLMEKGARPKK